MSVTDDLSPPEGTSSHSVGNGPTPSGTVTSPEGTTSHSVGNGSTPSGTVSSVMTVSAPFATISPPVCIEKTPDGPPGAMIDPGPTANPPTLNRPPTPALSPTPTPTSASARHESRGQWSSQVDFILSLIGYAVGLGNVWRFPYLCYKNGGGAFLVPYCLMLFTTGLPMLCLELTVGQYASLGPSRLFGSLAPLFSGVGYGMVLVTFFIACYYNIIMAWTIFYTVASFRSTLGWSNCANQYNTINCYTVAEERACLNSSEHTALFWNRTCYPIAAFCDQHGFRQVNATHCVSRSDPSRLRQYSEIGIRISASEDYFTNYVLGLRDHWWDDFGGLKWDLCLCLLAAWLIVGLCLIRGVKSSGKVVYFTAIFPYFVLVILLIRGVTLDGASDGIAFYITPNTTRLADSRVWSDAATQIFYSIGLSLGGPITLASYNRFNNNCMRDAILVGLINCGTSVFAGFVVFAILGFMAKSLGKEVSEVVTSGTGLTFIAYPEAVVHLPISPLWAVLFFVMIITLGLDSQFTFVETLLTAIYDQWPSLRTRKTLVVTVSAMLGFLLSISMCARGGIHLFTLLDWYASSYSVLVLALLEVLIVGWALGADRLLGLMQRQMGIRIPRPLRIYYSATWRFISPLCIIAITVFSLVSYVPAYYGTGERKRPYPAWANALGWLIALAPLLLVAIEAARRLHRSEKGWRHLLRPSSDWCPASERPLRGPPPEKAPAHATSAVGVANPAFVPEHPGGVTEMLANGTSRTRL